MGTMPKTQAGRVVADVVAYRYLQNGRGLDPTTLAIQPGELVLVAGSSGCGKSTLARCLTGLIPHLYRGTFTGAVWLGGLRTTKVPLWRLAERAGMVFQNPTAQMLAASVEEELAFGLENLGLSTEVIRRRLDATSERFGLGSLRHRSPRILSGGEQQKLALAAIMARQPVILGLDEPFSMLDSTAAVELVGYLAELVRSGTTVIICEHREEYLQGIPELRTVRLDSHEASQTMPIDESVTPVFSSPAPPSRVEVEGLTVRLDGRVVLRDLSFSASGGEVIAVVGRNGVGKTTLLRAMTGLQAHEGVVSVGGEQPDLGMVYQNAGLQLFNASVREEILYNIPNPDMALYAQLLNALGLAHYEKVPPLLLSEGEKKRVALAAVLMRCPRHGVLLDEPALGQDATHKAMLLRIARGLAAAGRFVILATHDLKLATQADRLLLLGREGLVADGPPRQVVRDPTPWAEVGLCVPPWVALARLERRLA